MAVNIVQQQFRLRTDSADVNSAATFGAALNANFNWDTTIFRLRFTVANIGTTSSGATACYLYASRNGGAYAAVNTSTTFVITTDATAGASTNNEVITSAQLPAGTGTFSSIGEYNYSGITTTLAIVTGTYIELEFGIQFTLSAVSGDTYAFRVYKAATPLTSYTVTPTVTFVVASADSDTTSILCVKQGWRF